MKNEIILTGVIAKAGVPDKNGMFFSEELLKDIADKMNQRIISENDVYGEIGFSDYKCVRLNKISHKNIDVIYDDVKKEITGSIKIENTPMGNVVKAIVDKFGVKNFMKTNKIRLNGIYEMKDDEISYFKPISANIIPVSEDPYEGKF